MEKKPVKKLKLNVETLRDLTTDELDQVAAAGPLQNNGGNTDSVYCSNAACSAPCG